MEGSEMIDDPGHIPSDNIERLPVKYLGPLPDRSLCEPWEVNQGGKCSHLFVAYIVDEASADVECGSCHEKLNPMWVLKQLATSDRRHAESRDRTREMSKRLDEKRRTKCQHCGKLTRVRL